MEKRTRKRLTVQGLLLHARLARRKLYNNVSSCNLTSLMYLLCFLRYRIAGVLLGSGRAQVVLEGQTRRVECCKGAREACAVDGDRQSLRVRQDIHAPTCFPGSHQIL